MNWSIPPWQRDPVNFILLSEAELAGEDSTATAEERSARAEARAKELRTMPAEKRLELARDMAMRVASRKNLAKSTAAPLWEADPIAFILSRDGWSAEIIVKLPQSEVEAKLAELHAQKEALSLLPPDTVAARAKELAYADGLLSDVPDSGPLVREVPPEVQAVLDVARTVVSPYTHTADIDFWAKHDIWRPNEATALSFGLDPKYFSRILGYRARQVNSAAFKAVEVANNRATLIERTFTHRAVAPRAFIEWALTMNVPIHPGLQPAVEQYGGALKDLRSALAQANEERDEVRAECDRLRQSFIPPAGAESAPTSGPCSNEMLQALQDQLLAEKEKVALLKERLREADSRKKSLQKIAYGVARAKFKYGEPNPRTGSPTNGIVSALAFEGIKIDKGTVRTALNAAAAALGALPEQDDEKGA